MSTLAPTAEFIYSVFWLGCAIDDDYARPIGSGVAIQHDGQEYLATALHVAKDCNFNPLIRRQKQWMQAKWEIIATDELVDIAILKTNTGKLLRLVPKYGTANTVIGGIGRAMGFPAIFNSNELDLYAETPDGHPVPMAVLISTYYVPSDRDDRMTYYTGGYVNSGFSGGAMLFSTEKDWTIAGVITTKGYTYKELSSNINILEPSGLIGYCDVSTIQKLITESQQH